MNKDREKTKEDLGHPENMLHTRIDEVGGNVEDVELGELDLEGIEKTCDNLKTWYIPFIQLVLFRESLIKTKGSRGLRVVSDSMKRGEGKQRGRRTNS